MSFTLDDVKELREKTGAGMMDCKKALQESAGNVEAAFDYLRKKGLATAAKKATRAAAEGIITDKSNGDGSFHVLVDVNCETDFVVKTDDFKQYAAELTKLVFEKHPKNVDELLGLKLGGKIVKDYQTDLVAKIGENIQVRRFAAMKVEGSDKVAKYIHAGSKIGVLVKFADPNKKLPEQLAREVAMHVAAMSPVYVGKDDVSADYIEREKVIYREQMAGEKKPPEIIEKIILGKLNKNLGEICLEDQIFVKDLEGKESVKNVLKKVDSAIKVKEFVRLQVGEGIEKKKGDLASEVAEMVK